MVGTGRDNKYPNAQEVIASAYGSKIEARQKLVKENKKKKKKRYPLPTPTQCLPHFAYTRCAYNMLAKTLHTTQCNVPTPILANFWGICSWQSPYFHLFPPKSR